MDRLNLVSRQIEHLVGGSVFRDDPHEDFEVRQFIGWTLRLAPSYRWGSASTHRRQGLFEESGGRFPAIILSTHSGSFIAALLWCS